MRYHAISLCVGGSALGLTVTRSCANGTSAASAPGVAGRAAAAAGAPGRGGTAGTRTDSMQRDRCCGTAFLHILFSD